MNIFFEIILVTISIITTSNIILKKRYCLFTFIFFVYEVLYVLPIVFYWILGMPDYKHYIGYNMAVNDEITDIVYCILISIGILIFYFYLMKKKNIDGNAKIFPEIKLNKFIKKNRRVIILLLMFCSMLPLLGIILSPNPKIYLTTLGYFSSPYNYPSQNELLYRESTSFIISIALPSLIAIKFLSENILVRLFSVFCIIFFVLFEGKRTSFAFLMFALVFIDIYKSYNNKNKSRIISRLMIISLIVLGYFYIYGTISGKNEINSISVIDTFRQYFFRDADLKLAIYWRINPKNYYLLDYNGQSLLYNILFFIKREFWINKPWPYDVYATCGALGLGNFVYFNWNVQVNWLSELVANLGIIGFFLGIYSYIILDMKTTKINKPIVTIYVFYYFIIMSTLGFNSAQLETVILFFLIIIYSKKRFRFTK
ncbi:O-antigen polymerase [Clostridium perfringens]|nr:O-antigen polymerase [Clostridium perfringens]